MSADLVTFIRARLDEKAAEANDFHDALRCGSLDRDGGFELRWCDCGHPARMLREVEAKRAILMQYQTARQLADVIEEAQTFFAAEALWDALLALAAVYSNHPDYQQEWRP